MFLIAEPLRNLGPLHVRRRGRGAAAADADPHRRVDRRRWPSSSFYLIAQMVGAGNLIRLLFGLPYELAVVIVGVVMLAYVLFGGMIATTWVQIVKAVLLLGGATLLARAGARALRLQSAGALRRGAAALRRRRAEPGPAGHRSRSTRSRSGWR